VISARSTDQAQETGRPLGWFAANQTQIGSWEIFANHIDRTKPALEQLQENSSNNLNAFIRNSPQELPTEVNRNTEGVFIHFLKEVLATDEVPYEMIQYSLIFKEKQHGETFIRAVKYYQERHGLPADGMIDPGGLTSQLLEEDIRERLR
jgi:murein L,D-transpeptidase YcbB/YkuD